MNCRVFRRRCAVLRRSRSSKCPQGCEALPVRFRPRAGDDAHPALRKALWPQPRAQCPGTMTAKTHERQTARAHRTHSIWRAPSDKRGTRSQSAAPLDRRQVAIQPKPTRNREVAARQTNCRPDLATPAHAHDRVRQGVGRFVRGVRDVTGICLPHGIGTKGEQWDPKVATDCPSTLAVCSNGHLRRPKVAEAGRTVQGPVETAPNWVESAGIRRYAFESARESVRNLSELTPNLAGIGPNWADLTQICSTRAPTWPRRVHGFFSGKRQSRSSARARSATALPSGNTGAGEGKGAPKCSLTADGGPVNPAMQPRRKRHRTQTTEAETIPCLVEPVKACSTRARLGSSPPKFGPRATFGRFRPSLFGCGEVAAEFGGDRSLGARIPHGERHLRQTPTWGATCHVGQP